ncbi:hypothetical protein FXO38_33695 [Capsicum annuum]|nr:hypothetical protein FXO38_33695 [Capsicum annuum]
MENFKKEEGTKDNSLALKASILEESDDDGVDENALMEIRDLDMEEKEANSKGENVANKKSTLEQVVTPILLDEQEKSSLTEKTLISTRCYKVNMSLIPADYYDYDMGDYDCSEGFYGYEVVGDYGGYENSYDQGMGRFESYGFEGENEVNEVPSAYGEMEMMKSIVMVFMIKLGRMGVLTLPKLKLELVTSYQCRHGMNGYTSYNGGYPMRRRGYASPEPKGDHVPYNIDARRNVHSEKVIIYGVSGCLIVLDDRCYRIYILPSMVDYLGLFREPLLVPYSLNGFKVTKRVKVVFSQFEFHKVTLPYKYDIPRAICNPPLTWRGSLTPKFAARVEVSKSTMPQGRH